jgi:uncharacterized phiE125 gp8 family phage protein
MTKYSVNALSPPVAEPVSLADMKTHLKVVGDGNSPDSHPDDDLIEMQIKAARAWCINYLGYAVVQQQFRLYLDEFPEQTEDTIELPLSKLISIDAVTYVDENGAQQTWASSNYSADTASVQGRLLRGYDVAWPDTRPQRQAVQITYTAGAAPTADSPPDYLANVEPDIIAAIKLIVGDLYEIRQDTITGTIVNKLKMYESLLHPHRRMRL